VEADLVEVEMEEVQRLEVDLQHGEECQVEDDPGEVDLRLVEVLLLEEVILEVEDQVVDLWVRSAAVHLVEDLPSLDLEVDLSLEHHGPWVDLRVLKVWDLRLDLPVEEVESWTETQTDAAPAWWRR